jgi:hypothetical protein
MFLKSCQGGKETQMNNKLDPFFNKNMIDEEFIEKPQDHIHHFGNSEPRESKTFLTKDEHDSFVSQEEE